MYRDEQNQLNNELLEEYGMDIDEFKQFVRDLLNQVPEKENELNNE